MFLGNTNWKAQSTHAVYQKIGFTASIYCYRSLVAAASSITLQKQIEFFCILPQVIATQNTIRNVYIWHENAPGVYFFAKKTTTEEAMD